MPFLMKLIFIRKERGASPDARDEKDDTSVRYTNVPVNECIGFIDRRLFRGRPPDRATSLSSRRPKHFPRVGDRTFFWPLSVGIFSFGVQIRSLEF